MKTQLALFVTTLLFAAAAHADTVACPGYATEAHSSVSGHCTDGQYEGIVLLTGATVHAGPAACSPGADYAIYDAAAGLHVSGYCESAPAANAR